MTDFNDTSKSVEAFLAGGNEMAAHIMAHDWSDSLGTIDGWPRSLKTTVSMLVHSPVPIVLLWGADGIMIYNDAYSVFAGRNHLRLLGCKVREGWPEVAAFNDNVMNVVMAGGTLSYKDLELTLRRSGKAEPAWMNLDYSPVIDESGKPGGVIAIVVETTARVLAERRAAAEQQRIMQMFEQGPSFMTMLSGTEHRIVFANSAYLQLVGRRDVVGKTVEEALPDAVEQGYLSLLNSVFKSGNPFRSNGAKYAAQPVSGGPIDERFVDFVFQPVKDANNEVTGIFVEGVDVTERTLTEKALQARESALRMSEKRYRSLFESIDAAFCIIEMKYDANGAAVDYEFIETNPAFERQTGLRRPIGKSIRQLMPAIEQYWIDIYAAVDRTGESARFENHAEAMDNRWYDVFAFRSGDADEHRVAILFNDISLRKQAEQVLRESEAQFRTFAQAMPNHVWTATPEGLLDWFNDRVYEYSAADPGTLDGADWMAKVHPDDLSSAMARWAEALSTGNIYEIEFRLLRSDDVYRWHIARAVAIKDAAGKITRWLGTNTDIHERKLVEAEVNRDLDRVWKNSRDLHIIVGVDGIFRAVNPASTAILGYQADEIVGHNFLEFAWPEDIGLAKSGHDIAVSVRNLTNFESRCKHKDGTARWISWHTSFEGGLVYGYGRDITVEKNASEALERSEAQLRSIVETTHIYQGLLELDGTVLNANTTALGGIKASLSDVIGKPFWETPWFAQTPGMPELIREAVSTVAQGGSLRREMRLNLPIGWRWFDFAIRPLLNEQDAVVALVPEAADITDRRAAEDALRQAQKMEAVGQLTGGIAHDFNNLLQAITGSLDRVQRRLADGRIGDVDRFLKAAVESANRAAALTHRLLAFSRRQTLDPKPTDVNRLIGGMENLIRGTMGPQVVIEVVGAAGLWPVRIDASQLENSLLNLCINARDAMPNGGSLTIETANKWMDERAARERELPAGQYVSMSVTDTGSGMERGVIERAFDPFFTTKPLGKGTGLGLSMIYGFVRQSGGQVRVYSEVGKGTTMSLYFPRYFGDAELSTDPISTESLEPGSGEIVLVVDDEAMVRMLVTEVLTEAGYKALEAPDGPAALKIVQSDTRIDLLITDVGLPGGMNGRQVADAARMLRKDMKVLFITGFAENAVVGNGHLDTGMEILAKPFAMSTLGNKVREMLER